MALAYDLEAIMAHPANRERIRKAAAAEIKAREQQEAIAEAEAARLREWGTELDQAEEKRKCRHGPVAGAPYASPSAEGCIYWLKTYVWTYNPKLVGRRDPETRELISPYVRFIPFPRQEEMVRWVFARCEAEEQGAVPKSRDIGATYIFGAVALHRWLFEEGFKATFGSRVEKYVDEKDNPDAIFPKIRIMARRLPSWMMPTGFDWRRDDNYMRLANPETGGLISGEGGKNMGRGGRSTMFIGDEAAFWENAEAVESALSGNTDVIFWVSSANGMGNLFARKVLGGLDPRQVFRFHYTDDPRKTAEWVAKKKQELSSNPVAWASEYEIDFAASLEGVCIPGAWVAACQELHRRIPPQPRAGGAVAGLDVGAGKSKSVFISRNGPRVRPPQARGDPDTTGTAAWALGLAREQGVVLVNFDAPGVGVGVTSALKHIPPLPNGDRAPLVVMPINTGGNPSKSRRWPDGRTSYETFGNLKAEIWWLCRTAAQRSFELLQFLDGVLDADGNEMGVEHDLDDCLLLPSKDPESDVLAMQLSVVKAETNIPGKIVIETKASLKKRGILSPDHADALVLTWVDKRSRYSLDALS